MILNKIKINRYINPVIVFREHKTNTKLAAQAADTLAKKKAEEDALKNKPTTTTPNKSITRSTSSKDTPVEVVTPGSNTVTPQYTSMIIMFMMNLQDLMMVLG